MCNKYPTKPVTEVYNKGKSTFYKERCKNNPARLSHAPNNNKHYNANNYLTMTVSVYQANALRPNLTPW